MADFRKYVLAFAGIVSALGITGVANAQTQLTCTASASTPFDMRAEGVTEQAGDVVVLCTGGTPTPSGTAVPQVNITVTANANITSRLINGSSSQTEALLLINDPQPLVQSYCPTTNTGCPLTATGLGGSGAVIGNSYAIVNGGTPRYNSYGGTLVSNNIVTFFGVPVDPPGTGQNLTLRITDIRMNVSSLGAPASGSFSTIPAFETISSSSGFTINNPVQTVGNVRRGLVVGAITAGSGISGTSTSGTPSTLQQCSSTSFTSTTVGETIAFSEGFATATKLRTPSGVGAANVAPQSGTNPLAIPGNFLNSESQFVPAGYNFPAGIGLADTATRIKITFNNVQNGVTIYVPTSINSVPVNGAVTETLQLVSSETAGEAGFVVPIVGATTGVTNLPGGFAAITVASGSGVAVYEVTSQTANSTSTIESFLVPAIVSFTASPGTNSPALGTSTVNVDFAPSTGSVLTATSGPIPRFVPTSTALNGFTINACQSVLLFPFLSNLAGFDTGMAISNTSTDPFGTTPQTGSCTLNFYGSGAPAAFITPTIASGIAYTNLVSTVAPGFQGYMIAQCRFQYAHGFAFITDGFGGPGRGLSEGYLALVLPDPNANGGRSASTPDKSAKGTGEAAAQ